MAKRRILALIDTPTCATGFGAVARNVLRNLYDTGNYDIDIIGINHYGDPYDIEKFPYYIVPANYGGVGDIYGKKRLAQTMHGLDPVLKPPYDFLFTVNDPFILEDLPPFVKDINKSYLKLMNDSKANMSDFIFKWIAYWPVDSKLKGNWVDSIIGADYPVMYTDYGLKQVQYYQKDVELPVIPHGVNTTDFHPVNQKVAADFRNKYFNGKIKKSHFLVTNVSRNQPRKDIMRTLIIFREFQKRVPSARLYLHMRNDDAGGNVEEMATEIGLKEEYYFLPKNFNENSGLPLETLNLIYNASDVLFTTTLGEGWGFINTEGMACKRVVVAPSHTSIPEIFNGHAESFDTQWKKYRGVPMKAGTNLNEWTTLGSSDYGRLRPLTNIEDGVSKLMWVYNNPDKVDRIVKNGYRWVQTMTWKNVCEKWIKLFDFAWEALNKERNEYNLKQSVIKNVYENNI